MSRRPGRDSSPFTKNSVPLGSVDRQAHSPWPNATPLHEQPGAYAPEESLPDRAARPHAVAVGADGACWFTEWALHTVGRLDRDDDLAEHPLPSGALEPHGIAAGPDGAIWTACESGSLVRLTPEA